MTNSDFLLPSAAPDLQPLLERARTLVLNAKGEKTRSGYRRDFEAYLSFCTDHRLVAMPASESTVCLYLAFCSTRFRPATIARRMAALADGLKRANHDTTALRGFLVQETWKGIKRTLGVAQHGKAPLLASAIRQIVLACPDTLLGRRDRSLMLTGFFGGFRRSELGLLELGDLTSYGGKILISLARSKNDQQGEGRIVVLLPSEDTDMCPVRAMDEWISGGSLEGGFLYRSVDRHGNVSANINPDSIPRIMKRAAARAGLSPSQIAEIAAHSLRAGLVTQASISGISPLAVMEITGHRTMAVVKRYSRVAEAIGAAEAIASGL